MKLKNLTEEEKENIASIIDNEGFWYACAGGGYLRPEDVLEDEADIKRVTDAIEIVREFQYSCPQL